MEASSFPAEHTREPFPTTEVSTESGLEVMAQLPAPLQTPAAFKATQRQSSFRRVQGRARLRIAERFRERITASSRDELMPTFPAASQTRQVEQFSAETPALTLSAMVTSPALLRTRVARQFLAVPPPLSSETAPSPARLSMAVS